MMSPFDDWLTVNENIETEKSWNVYKFKLYMNKKEWLKT